MLNYRRIYAVERDQKRFKTLKEIIVRCGAKCVTPLRADIFQAKLNRTKIEYILLDPSCSGSGKHTTLICCKIAVIIYFSAEGAKFTIMLLFFFKSCFLNTFPYYVFHISYKNIQNFSKKKTAILRYLKINYERSK